MLQLPAMPLRALEAAIMPAPLPQRSADGKPLRAKAEQDTKVKTEEGGEADQAEEPEVLYDPNSIVDYNYIASAALLRDLHAGLLRMIDNHAPRKQELPQEVRMRVRVNRWGRAVHKHTAAVVTASMAG